MDAETALGALAGAGRRLPRDAMRWALDHWDEAAPVFLAALERYVDGTDRSEEAASAAFFILHLAAERRDSSAFAPLCRLAQNPEATEQALGDAVTITLKAILISTYDGDLDALKAVIEEAAADEYARASAFEALAYLTATGRVAREEAEAYLSRLCDTLQAESGSFAWYGWTATVALLGLESLAPLVQQAFARGFIDRTFTTYKHFRQDLQRTLADPEGMAGFQHDSIAPLEDATGELERQFAFSDREDEESTGRPEGGGQEREPWVAQEPAVNPFKNVGRNDPCPCGSGRKFKKCCLPRASAAGAL
jgi:hypothetical protein